MKTAIIIGCGVAGLATSIRLARKGYKVTILEKNAYPGGKLTSFEMNGYRFDAGPSLFTLPELVTELLDPEFQQEFRYAQLKTSCTYFWNDKDSFVAPAHSDEFCDAVATKFNVKPMVIRDYLNDARYKFKITRPIFLESNIHHWKNHFTSKFIKAYFKLPFLGIFKAYHQYNKGKLKNPKLVQIVDRLATYNGSSPYQTSAIHSLLAHLEFEGGTYFPINGMHDITKILVKQAQLLEVDIKYNTPVKHILKSNSKIDGITTETNQYKADLVISNLDAHNTYLHLLNEPLPKSQLTEKSSSGLVFYWGINHSFDQLNLHNIFFTEDYKGEFDNLFNKKKLSKDPTIYVHRSCEISKNDAPDGKENWFVMINVPSEPGLFTNVNILKAKKRIINKLSRILDVQISKFIECEKVLTPNDIERNTGAFKGALYGASSNDLMAAFKRHPNHSKFGNLFFVGGTVHPGGGIPLCLLSAKIVANEC